MIAPVVWRPSVQERIRVSSFELETSEIRCYQMLIGVQRQNTLRIGALRIHLYAGGPASVLNAMKEYSEIIATWMNSCAEKLALEQTNVLVCLLVPCQLKSRDCAGKSRTC